MANPHERKWLNGNDRYLDEHERRFIFGMVVGRVPVDLLKSIYATSRSLPAEMK